MEIDMTKPDFYQSLRHAVETVGNLARTTRDLEHRDGLFRQRDAVLAALRVAEDQRDRKAQDQQTIEDLQAAVDSGAQRVAGLERGYAMMAEENDKLRAELYAERCKVETVEATPEPDNDNDAAAYAKAVSDYNDLLDDVKRRARPAYMGDPERPTLLRLAAGVSNSYLHRTLIDIAESADTITSMKSALIVAAADRLGVDVYPSDEALKRRPVSKGELAEALYPADEGYSVDCALPQNWIDSVENRMDDVERAEMNAKGGLAAQFVTVYHPEHEPHGQIMPITKTGIYLMAQMST